MSDRQSFLQAVNGFWGKMGDPTFWGNPAKQERELETLGNAYLRVKHGENANEDRAYLGSALEEYEARKALMERGWKYWGIRM